MIPHLYGTVHVHIAVTPIGSKTMYEDTVITYDLTTAQGVPLMFADLPSLSPCRQLTRGLKLRSQQWLSHHVTDRFNSQPTATRTSDIIVVAPRLENQK